jgi:hypothetical protein
MIRLSPHQMRDVLYSYYGLGMVWILLHKARTSAPSLARICSIAVTFVSTNATEQPISSGVSTNAASTNWNADVREPDMNQTVVRIDMKAVYPSVMRRQR